MKILPISNNFNKIHNVKPVFNKKVSNPVKNDKVLMSAAAASAIAATAMIKKPDVSVEDIEKKLIKNGYKKDKNGVLKKTFSAKENKLIDEKYGTFADSYRFIMQKPITREDNEYFADFINKIDKKQGQKMFNENFDKLFLIYKVLKDGRAYNDFVYTSQEDKAYYQLFSNIVNSNIDEKGMHDITSYKTDTTSSMNFSLREKALNKDYQIPQGVQEKIDAISSHIDTQVISKPITVYRGEGFQVLNNVKLQNGKTIDLGKMMQDASINKDKKKILKIKEIVADNEISTVQNGFLSTSINKQVGDRFSRDLIVWELTTKPNTKGIFVEGLNMYGVYSDEEEVLFQKDSKITINDVNYDMEKDIWIVKGQISN